MLDDYTHVEGLGLVGWVMAVRVQVRMVRGMVREVERMVLAVMVKAEVVKGVGMVMGGWEKEGVEKGKERGKEGSGMEVLLVRVSEA